MKSKTYYTIKEVSDMSGLEPYVLRYWETVFADLKPRKHKGNRRMYTLKDIETIKLIKHLLYEKKFTIKGANEYMKNSEQIVQLKLDFSEKIDKEYVSKMLYEILNVLKGKMNEK